MKYLKSLLILLFLGITGCTSKDYPTMKMYENPHFRYQKQKCERQINHINNSQAKTTALEHCMGNVLVY